MGSRKITPPGGVSLNCLAEGPGGDAPWVVFGNSLMTDLSIWDAQARALSDRFNVLRYNARGHGASGIDLTPLDFDILSSDLIAVMDGFSVETCSYVGLSMGVPTGLAAFSRHRHRFQRLAFLDGQAQTAPTGFAHWQERIDSAGTNGMDRIADETVARWLRPDATIGDPGRRLKRIVAATPLAGFIACARALQDYDYSAVVPTIDLPLLALAGACDGAMPQTMQRVFGPVPGAQVAQIAEAGHVPNFEEPEATNAILVPFLEARS